MPVVNVLDGSAARAIHVRQILGWLRGVPTNSEPTKFIGITNTDEHALTVRNNDATYQKALSVENAAGTIKLLEVTGGRTILRPNTDGSTILSIRNYADSADVFTVSTTGASLGSSGDVVTTTATQELTNKTITSGILGSSRLSNWLDVQRQVSAPANPASGDFRLYALTGTSFLNYRDSSGVERVLVDTSSIQSLASKTLTDPTLTSPLIQSGAEFQQGSAPGDPGLGLAALYYLTGANNYLKYKAGNNTERTIVITDTEQTLEQKTLTAPSLSTPIISGGATFAIGSAPSGPGTSAAVLYYLTATNDLRYMAGNSTERTIVDTGATQTLTGKTLTNPTLNTPTIGAGGALFTIGTAPGTPGASAAVLYYLTATNDLRYKAGNNTERTFVDTDSTQTLSSKTLTTPTINTPIIGGGATFSIGAAPASPGSSAAVLYYLTATNDLRYKAGNNTERVLVDLDSTQTLSNKTFTTPTFTAATLNNPIVSNYEDFQQQAVSPGNPSSGYWRMYFSTGNSVKLRAPAGTEQTILTDTNSALVTAVGWVRPMLLGGFN